MKVYIDSYGCTFNKADGQIMAGVLLENEIEIIVNLGDGDASATAWGCDLTYDYVKINGDYRT